jgi:hypothetical protein
MAVGPFMWVDGPESSECECESVERNGVYLGSRWMVREVEQGTLEVELDYSKP